jgi:hypothetical protein
MNQICPKLTPTLKVSAIRRRYGPPTYSTYTVLKSVGAEEHARTDSNSTYTNVLTHTRHYNYNRPPHGTGRPPRLGLSAAATPSAGHGHARARRRYPIHPCVVPPHLHLARIVCARSYAADGRPERIRKGRSRDHGAAGRVRDN